MVVGSRRGSRRGSCAARSEASAQSGSEGSEPEPRQFRTEPRKTVVFYRNVLEARLTLKEMPAAHMHALVVSESGVKPLDVSADEPFGPMRDFLFRELHKLQRTAKDQSQMTLKDLLKGMMPNELYLLDQDLLNATLQDIIFDFWNYRPEAQRAWPRSDGSALRRHFTQIAAHKKRLHLLQRLSNKWHFRNYILESRLRDLSEPQRDRYNRLQGFWLQMHGRHANSLPLSTESCGLSLSRRPRDAKASAVESHACSDAKVGNRFRTAPAGDEEDMIRTLVASESLWKHRAGKSKCSVGTWNWAHTAGSDTSPQTPSDKGVVGINWWEEVHQSLNRNVLPEAELDSSRAPISAEAAGLSSPHGFAGLKDSQHSRSSFEVGILRCTPGGLNGMNGERIVGGANTVTAPRQSTFPDRSYMRWWQKSDKVNIPGSTLKPPISLIKPRSLRSPSSGSRNGLVGYGTLSLPSLEGTKREPPKSIASPTRHPSKPMRAQSAVTRHSSKETTLPLLSRNEPLSYSSAMTSSPSSGFNLTLQFMDIPGSGQDSPNVEVGEGDMSPHLMAAVVEPWQGICQTLVSPSRAYLMTCQNNGVVPALKPFFTGDSSKVRLRGLEDSDLNAMAAMLRGGAKLVEVDLTDNPSLTDAALANFIDCFRSQAHMLKRLNLERCSGAGQATMGILMQLLGGSVCAYNLTYLNLSYIMIGVKSQIQLGQVVHRHPALVELHIAGTGLGGKSCARQVLTDILNSASLTKLDLSWNSFSADVFAQLGEMADIGKLYSLNLASCSSAEQFGNSTPVMLFIESLARNNTLTHLDVSFNHIDARGALIVEDALCENSQLVHLNVANNPLGVHGLRCFLRLLARDTSGLMHFDCHGTCSGGNGCSGDVTFSMTNPGGRYPLNLFQPYHRAVLRMLYKLAERFSLSTKDAFLDVVPSSFAHATKDSSGIYVIPTKGKVSFTFSIEQNMETMFAGVGPWNFGAYIKKHFSLFRCKPCERKIIPLLAEWIEVSNMSQERDVFLDALSKDFDIEYALLALICRQRECACEAMARLLPNLQGGTPALYLCMSQAPSLRDYSRLTSRLQSFFYFNIENPTGRYRLRMESCTDFAVADQVILIDNWEISVDRRLKRVDTSERGNRSHIRNARYQDISLPCTVAEWQMPETGILEFDYSSGKRVSSDETPIDDETFQKILLVLAGTQCNDMDQVQSIRTVSHLIYLTSGMFRQMLGIYKDSKPRNELFILFFFRIIDIWNEKVFRVRFDSKEELLGLQRRLGFATFFPFIQPEQCDICLDFTHSDQRMAMSIINSMAVKENSGNLREPVYILENGKQDPLTLGVPKSWEDFSKVPKGGSFTARYVCSPDNRNFAIRKKLLSTFGFWDCPVKEDEISWWAAPSQVPPDIMELLYFLSSRFENVEESFEAIDGEGGNGQVSLREFEEGLEEMKFKKFEGPNEKQRINGVFRYLDPSGEGQVSKDEWGVLGALWNEIQLSIKEFVQFLERTCGDDLLNAWRRLDADGSGEINWEEWGEAVNELGYFGPTEPIFRYLDKDDQGDVSFDEFVALYAFASHPRAERDDRISSDEEPPT